MNRLHWATLIVIPIFIIGIYAYKDAHIILDKSKESYVKQDGITSIGYDNGKKAFKVLLIPLLSIITNTFYIRKTSPMASSMILTSIQL